MSDAYNIQADKQGEAALARLTANEKECLRRRLLPQTAKEMATDLGISPHAVEKRLKMARAKLGVSSSLAAARLLAGAEEDQLLVPHIPDLPDGTNQSQDGGVAVPSVWATSIPKGLSMIAVICLIALVGQDAPSLSAASRAQEMSASVQNNLANLPTDGVYWREHVRRETIMMAVDIASALNNIESKSSDLNALFLQQVYFRKLSEAIMFKVVPKGGIQIIKSVNPYNQAIDYHIVERDIASISSVGGSINVSYGGHIGTIARLPAEGTFLYAARVPN
jgi:DNA-binding CsgD family transcriptional regulator